MSDSRIDRMSESATFSIKHPNPYSVGEVPIPVRFHVSREIWEDETVTPEDIADVLRFDLVTAITAHRTDA